MLLSTIFTTPIQIRCFPCHFWEHPSRISKILCIFSTSKTLGIIAHPSPWNCEMTQFFSSWHGQPPNEQQEALKLTSGEVHCCSPTHKESEHTQGRTRKEGPATTSSYQSKEEAKKILSKCSSSYRLVPWWWPLVLLSPYLVCGWWLAGLGAPFHLVSPSPICGSFTFSSLGESNRCSSSWSGRGFLPYSIWTQVRYCQDKIPEELSSEKVGPRYRECVEWKVSEQAMVNSRRKCCLRRQIWVT